jgi:hypothetical protein
MFTSFVRVPFVVVYLIVAGSLLMGCSTHNVRLVKKQNSVPALVQHANIGPQFIEAPGNARPYSFEHVPYIMTNKELDTDYVHKLLLQLGNGDFLVVILEDNEGSTTPIILDTLNH